MGFFILFAVIAWIAIRAVIKADKEGDKRISRNREESEARRIMEARGMTKAVKTQTETVKVVGTSFRTENILHFAEENEGYSASKRERVEDDDEGRQYQYTFSPKTVELVDEPDNPHDPNAIRVDFDGLTVGYIGKGDQQRVRDILASGRINRMEPEIGGGKYRELVLNDEDLDDDAQPKLSDYDLDTDETEYFARIHFHLRPEVSTCPNCGMSGKTGDKFCRNCGVALQ